MRRALRKLACNVTGLQYPMLRVSSSPTISAFTANGRTESFQLNFMDYLAAVAEVGAVHNSNINGNNNVPLDDTWTSPFGPRVSVTKRSSRIVSSVECLSGGVSVAASIRSPLLAEIPPRLTGGQTAFAMAVGGTLDRDVSARPVRSRARCAA
jgi:hypothetical protein